MKTLGQWLKTKVGKFSVATRIYCDLCGNTIRNPAKYVFGPSPLIIHNTSYQTVTYPGGGAGQLGGSYQTAMPTSTAYHAPTTIEVDLCPTCEKIWMKRVEGITKASAPDVLDK